MAGNTTVIEIVARVSDETAAGAASATANVSKLEKAFQRVQNVADGLKRKSNIELTADLNDNASKGITSILGKGREIAGKIWSVTVGMIDKASRGITTVIGMGKQIAGRVWSITVSLVDKITAPFRGILKMITNPIVMMAGMAGIGLGLKDVVQTGMGFEQNMANIRAVSNMATSEMEKLGTAIRGMGAEGFALNDVAAAAKNFVTVGSDAESVLGKLDHAMTLSQASGMDLYKTTYYLNSIMNKLGGDTELVGQAIDSMAMAAGLAHQPLDNIMSSWNYMGSAVRQANMSMDEANAVLVTLSDAGYRSSSAGTMFSRMMQDLLTPSTDAAAAALEDLGFSMFDAYGEVRPFGDAMQDLAKSLEAVESPYERINLLNDIFTVNGARAADVLLNNADSLLKYITEIEGAGDAFGGAGAAAGMAAIRMDTLEGAMKRLRGVTDAVKLSVADRLNPVMRDFVNWMVDRMPAVEASVIRVLDNIVGKARNFGSQIQNIIGSAAFQDADLFGRISILWDEVIAQPFSAWWQGSGQAKIAGVADDIGRGIGTFLRQGITGLLGINPTDAISDGVSIGKSFAGAFIEGFEPGKVIRVIFDAMWNFAKSHPLLTALIAGPKLLSGLSTGMQMFGNIKGLFGGGKPGAGGVLGSNLMTSNMNVIAQTVNVVGGAPGIPGGMFGKGTTAKKLGPAAAGGGKKFLAGAGGAALGLAKVGGAVIGGAQLITAGTEIFQSFREENKDTQDMLRRSATARGSGVAAGAAAGAAIGLFFGGVGAVPGALIGAGIGGLAGSFGANRIQNTYEGGYALAAEREAMADEMERQVALIQRQAMFRSSELRNALADPNISEMQFDRMFQREVMAGLDSRFGNIKLSLSEIDELAKRLTFGDALQEFRRFERSSNEVKRNMADIEARSESLAHLDWKFDSGFDWSPHDTMQYMSESMAAIASSRRLIQSRGYGAASGINLLMGGDGGSITDLTNRSFGLLQSQLNPIEEELQEMQNRGITTEDVPRMQELMSEKGQLLGVLDQAQDAGRRGALEARFGDIDQLDVQSFKQANQLIAQYKDQAFETLNNAFEQGMTDLKLAQFLDPELDIAPYVAALTEGKHEQKSQIMEWVKEFQSDILNNVFGDLADQLFSEDPEMADLDLTSKLQTALEAINVSGIDIDLLSPEDWKRFLNLKNLEDAVGVATIMTSMAQTMNTSLAAGVDMGPTQTNMERGLNSAIRSLEGILAGANLSVEVEVKLGPMPQLPSVTTEPQPRPGLQRPGPPFTAEGGIFNRPQLRIFAEDGPEAVIPLSKRARGLSLWEQAGEILGVRKPNKGVVVGGGSLGSESAASGSDVTVTIENISFEVNVDGGSSDVVKKIKDNINDLTDEIAYRLSMSIQESYANSPQVVGDVY